MGIVLINNALNILFNNDYNKLLWTITRMLTTYYNNILVIFKPFFGLKYWYN